MTAIELARRIAADLHRQAVERGQDPWRPYEFVCAEVTRHGLQVEPTAPGASVLRGARATFVREERLILHERTVTPFEQAFLVAHELGHVVLGDDPGGADAKEFDLGRPAEPSPLGLDRVVDYGRRQRREVQMDLFAREFLLPRRVARQLHIDAMCTASDIASRLGAPFTTVAQQLLDALLLPEVLPAAPRAAQRPPNPDQQAAASHRGSPFLLEAGPGTGKTRALVARVASLLDEGIDPRRVVVLTFSNRAAGELAERLTRTRADAAAAMWIGTFHGFGLDLIRRFHTELGFPTDPSMMDRTDAAELLERAFPTLGLVHYRDIYDPTQVIVDLLAAVSRAQDEVVDHARYASLAADMILRSRTDEARVAGEKALEVARVYEAYEGLKRTSNRVDFGDLVALPVRLLEQEAAIRAHLRGLYDHVLVDEYQDVNRASVRLLMGLTGDGRNLWVVGDAKQSIYRFRGASSFNMQRFGSADFPGGERGRLTVNYRSVSQVVDAYSAFSAQMKVRDGGNALEADRGTGKWPPELRVVDTAAQQTVALADAIGECREAGCSYRDQVVLCTGNDKLSTLAQDLERLGVPVLFLGSLFERTEVRDLLAFLSLLTDRWAMGLVRVATWPEFKMSLQDVSIVLAHLRSSSDLDAPVWWTRPLAIDGVSATGQAAFSRICSVLVDFHRAADPWTVLTALLLDRSRIACRLASSTDVAVRTQAIAVWQLLNFVRVQPRGQGLPIVRLLDRVRRLLALRDERDLRQVPAAAQGLDAVRLMTIHGAKGLEFPVVHIPGLSADTLPRHLQPPRCPPPDGMVEGGSHDAVEVHRAAHNEEQECLFYVALSRARDRLILYAPSSRSDGKSRRLSPFLDRLGLAYGQRPEVIPVRNLPVDPGSADVEVVVEGGLRLRETQLDLFERCPRRFFYTHVLQIGGRRSSSAFMQMHEAVRAVMTQLLADPAIAGADISARLDEAFVAQGLSGHGYDDEYREIARRMLRYLLGLVDEHHQDGPTEMVLRLGTDEVVVVPEQVTVGLDGRRVVRRIRTGHHRKSHDDSVATAAFLLAVQQRHPGARAEISHLSDPSTVPLTMSERKIESRREKLASFVALIRRGSFPPEPSSHSCPGCPAFFVCGSLPGGPLSKEFS